MKKNIVIIHYNTPHLTECLVRSINLFTKDAIIYVFDNSDKDPFVSASKFRNVIIIDNTKGDVINFDEWLENYPKKKLSNGRANEWGSAKHCYSVEKCMELIDENFFLLDSDILLKKDISELADETCIYVGETIYQPKSRVLRVLPFLCYINVNMCKENGVHYFDHNYMHGLSYTKENPYADRYDTGAGFYIHASKFNHKEIKLDEYIMHFGHGSWEKKGYNSTCTSEEWLEIHKSLWTGKKNKKVIYTCITGQYDLLKNPGVISPGFDYICFTDNTELTNQIWDIRPLPKEVENLSQIKKQRYIKLNPHKFLSEYDISVWVDGNVEIKEDINTLLSDVLKDDCSIYVPTHPARKCIYAEVKAVLSLKKDTRENIDPQIKRYESEGFPKNYGLLQSNIMIRKHNNNDCIKLMEAWTNELVNGSHRDQLSFNYVCWKNQDVMVTYLDKKIYESKWFHWGKVHGKSRYINTQKAPIGESIVKKESLNIKDRIERNKEFLNSLRSRKIQTHDVKIY